MLRRLSSRIGLALILSLSLMSPVLAGGDFVFKAGLGYEFLSQEFFLDSLARTGVDSLETITSLKTTFLDDVKGQLSVTYVSPEQGRLELGGILEQTPDIFRARFTGGYRPQWGKLKVHWQGELDWRRSLVDSAEAGDSYVLGHGKAKFMLPVSEQSTLWWQLRSEFVRFDSGGDYSFDHNRLSGKIGLSWSMADFSSMTINAFMMTRAVPDTSDLDYRAYGVEASYFSFRTRSSLDLFARLERKDYQQSEGQNDYLQLEFTGRHKVSMSDRFFSRQELDLEVLSFDQSDFINRNYTRARAVLQIGIQGPELSGALGPHIEILSENRDELLAGQDYSEAGIRANLDFFRPNLFGMAESTVGHRNIYSEADLLSDFVFHRLNLLFDWTFLDIMSLNAMISGEWEWHDNPSENSQLYLVSSWLTCRF